jgi:homoserine O-acetyltransferase
VRALVRAGREVSYAEVPSQYGHDAFLMPIPLYHDILRDYLARVAREVNAHAA